MLFCFNSPSVLLNLFGTTHTHTHTYSLSVHLSRQAELLRESGFRKQEERWGVVLSASHPLPADLPGRRKTLAKKERKEEREEMRLSL